MNWLSPEGADDSNHSGVVTAVIAMLGGDGMAHLWTERYQ